MSKTIGSEDIAKGIALRIAAAGAFSIMAAVLKLASLDGVTAPEMLFYRAFFGLPVVLIWVAPVSEMVAPLKVNAVAL